MEWVLEDAPTEKLYTYGRQVLNDAELLSIVIGNGTTNAEGYMQAKELLQLCDNSLQGLGRLTMSDMQRVRGIGKVSAAKVAALLELGRRRHFSDVMQKPEIKGSRDGYMLVARYLEGLNHEEAYMLCLNKGNKVLAVRRVSEGGDEATIMDAKKVFRMAIECRASAIMVAHNHPSGTLRPSQADIDLTKRLKAVGDQLGMPLVDHIIVSDEGYFSFLDEGLI